MQAGARAGADARAPQELFGEPDPAAAADDDGLLAALLDGRLLAHAAVPHADDAVGDRRRLRVVADEHRRRARFTRKLPDQPVDLPGVDGVELAGRFVGEEELGPVRKGRADRDALLFPARELTRVRVPPAGEPDPLEELVRSGEALTAGDVPASAGWSATSSRAESSAASARQ